MTRTRYRTTRSSRMILYRFAVVLPSDVLELTGRQQFGVDPVYGLNGNGVENGRFSSYSTGSTALYHHHGSRYGLGMNGRANGADSKMGGLHGPKHKRGDVDRECGFTHLLSELRMLIYDVQSIVSQARV